MLGSHDGCGVTLFPERCEQIPDTQLTTDQNKYTIRSNLVMQWGFLLLFVFRFFFFYRNMGERLLADAEMTQRQLYTKSYLSMHKSWKPGAHCTSSRQFKRLDSSFQNNSGGLSLFQDALLVKCFPGSSTWLRMTLSSPYCLYMLGEGGT